MLAAVVQSLGHELCALTMHGHMNLQFASANDDESNNYLCSTVNFHMQTRLYPRSYNTARNKIANICEIFITANYQKIPSQNVL